MKSDKNYKKIILQQQLHSDSGEIALKIHQLYGFFWELDLDVWRLPRSKILINLVRQFFIMPLAILDTTATLDTDNLTKTGFLSVAFLMPLFRV